jgi:hypothetical protein
MIVPTLAVFQIMLSYIDPNAGGWLFQLMFPVVVAIGGMWMVVRKRLGRFCSRLFRDRDNKDREHR